MPFTLVLLHKGVQVIVEDSTRHLGILQHVAVEVQVEALAGRHRRTASASATTASSSGAAALSSRRRLAAIVGRTASGAMSRGGRGTGGPGRLVHVHGVATAIATVSTGLAYPSWLCRAALTISRTFDLLESTPCNKMGHTDNRLLIIESEGPLSFYTLPSSWGGETRKEGGEESSQSLSSTLRRGQRKQTAKRE
jgi:hypothetical protein